MIDLTIGFTELEEAEICAKSKRMSEPDMLPIFQAYVNERGRDYIFKHCDLITDTENPVDMPIMYNIYNA